MSVSTADASRRVSFWLSPAASWSCCACFMRAADAVWSRRRPIEDWLATRARTTAPTETAAQVPSRQRVLRSNSSSSASKPDSAPPVCSSKPPRSLSGSFAMRCSSAPLKAATINQRPPPNQPVNINRKSTAIFRSSHESRRIRFPSDVERLYEGGSCGAFVIRISAAANPRSKCQIQNHTGNPIFSGGYVILTFAKVAAAKGCEC